MNGERGIRTPNAQRRSEEDIHGSMRIFAIRRMIIEVNESNRAEMSDLT